MRTLKMFIGTTAVLLGLALAPRAESQVVVEIGIQPVCQYGYFDYEPYSCAPYGFYGPGYFYNGIFLGMGPWAGWGYGHGWGRHRFMEAGGGSYHGRGGELAIHGRYAGGGQGRGGGREMKGRPQPNRNGGGRPNAGRPMPRGPGQHGNSGQGQSHRDAPPRGPGHQAGDGGHESDGHK